MQPEEVLELIRSAPERYETVRAALRYRGDGQAMAAVDERYLRSEAYRREEERVVRWPDERAEPAQPGTSGGHPLGPYGWRTRAWHADEYHWRLESDLPGGGVEIQASNGRRRLPIGGPRGSGLWWNHRVGAGLREDDPRWFALATDHYWNFYPLLTERSAGSPTS